MKRRKKGKENFLLRAFFSFSGEPTHKIYYADEKEKVERELINDNLPFALPLSYEYAYYISIVYTRFLHFLEN